MKILVATSEAVPNGGGIASYAQELLNVIGQEHEVYLLTDSPDKQVDGYRFTWSNYGHDIYAYSYAHGLVDELNAAKFDLIINSNSKFVAVCAPFLQASIISISHFVNGILAVTAGFNSKYLDAVICLSHYGKDFMRRRFRISDESKLPVVYNFVHNDGVELDRNKQQRTVPVIVYPGGCALHKSPDVVLSALRRLIRTDLNFKFYWLGGLDIPFKRFSIPKKINALLPADERVQFTGKIPREQAIALISSANLFLLPSRGEGCPISLLEAMCSGCIPVISDARHGSRELLESGKFGIITRQGNAPELFRRIREVIETPQNYQENYLATYNYSKHVLSKEKWTEEMQRIISSVMHKKKETLPMDSRRFRKSSWHFQLVCCWESYKIKFRDLFFCMKFNFLYFKGR